MAATDLTIMADGKWLNLFSLPGDITMSTIWPGGSDELSWTLGATSSLRFRGGEIVKGFYGGVCVWCGTLLEPDPSQEQLSAQGLWRLGDNFAALGAGGGASINPDVSIDQAISRGLQWTRPNSILNAQTPLDVSQGPVTVGALLDTYAENSGLRWGVNPAGEVYTQADPVPPTLPAYKTIPMAGGLGYALDNYASTLVCRYLDSATSTFKTVTVTDAAAASAHTTREQVVDLTGRGAITSTQATTFGNSLLTLGRSNPQWTTSLELVYGELLTMGGAAVVLEKVAAGSMVRVMGGFELAARQNGAMYVDFMIGQTSLSGGTLTLQPLLKTTRTYQDFVTDALAKKHAS